MGGGDGNGGVGGGCVLIQAAIIEKKARVYYFLSFKIDFDGHSTS